MVFLKYLRQFRDNFKLPQSSYLTLVIINEKSHLKIASILSFFKKNSSILKAFFFVNGGVNGHYWLVNGGRNASSLLKKWTWTGTSSPIFYMNGERKERPIFPERLKLWLPLAGLLNIWTSGKIGTTFFCSALIAAASTKSEQNTNIAKKARPATTYLHCQKPQSMGLCPFYHGPIFLLWLMERSHPDPIVHSIESKVMDVL